MKRFFLTLVGFLSVCSLLLAKQIDVRTAQTVAQTFLSGTSNLRSTSSLNLVYTCKDETLSRSGQAQNYYYVFNIGNNQGFIIISADDVNVPIVAYSTKGNYDAGNLPPNFKGWMDEVAAATKAGISRNVKSEGTAAQEWTDYKNGKVPMSSRAATSVAPLTKMKWNQGSPYSDAIPFKDGGSTPPVGCTATAMVQIMKYHSYPAKGIKATEAYTTRNGLFKVPSVDLTKVTYNWANMPNEYTSSSTAAQKSEVAKIMYHAGIAAKMDYKAGGSGASLYDAALALKENFNYDPTLQYIRKGTTSATEWKNKIKEELTAKRPILYAGYSTVGHAFVCDGYDKNGFFSFNWGWGGRYNDGYYNIDALIVGFYDFSQRHEMIMGIKPAQVTSTPNLTHTKGLTTNATSKKPGESFTTTVTIKNSGKGKFEGYHAVALTDANGNVKYVLNSKQSTTLATINANGTYTKTETCLVPTNATIGTYYVRFVQKEKGTTAWKSVSTGTSPYSVTFTVAGSFNLAHTKGLTTNATSKKPGESFTTTVTIKNSGKGKFEGYHAVALTDANGNVKYILNSKQSTTLATINANGTYTKTETCLVPSNATPGTYYVRFVQKEKGTTAWKAVSTGTSPYYVKFTVTGTPNLTHTKGLTTNATSKKPGESFTATVTIKNSGKGKFEGYHAVALTDANGNVKYILNSKQSTTLATINANGTYTKTETCLVPSNATPGTYYVRFVQKEKGTTAWKAVSTGTSPYYVKFTVTGTPNLTHEKGIAVSSDKKKPGETFTATVSLRNTGNGKFEGYYAIALVDASDNVKYILNTTQSTTLTSINANGIYTKTETCKIPSNAISSKYYIRIMLKEKGTTAWKTISRGASPWAKIFTVSAVGKYNLALIHGALYPGVQSGKPGQTFKMQIGFTNTGDKRFEGYYALALTDVSGNVKYILNQAKSKTLISLDPDKYYGVYSDACLIPTNAVKGTYYLRAVYKQKGTTAWKVINSYYTADFIKFTVTANTLRNVIEDNNTDIETSFSVYPNPVSDILHIKAGDTSIKRVMLTNMSGKVVLRENHSGNSAEIYVRDLPVGVYIVTVETDNGIVSKRIQKQ